MQIPQFAIDLAADDQNAKAAIYYGVKENALLQPWHPYCAKPGQWAWCNPPYGSIAPWVEKANVEMKLGGKIAMLLPAGVGANWYAQHVHREACVLALNGRITFVGHPTPYPKDLILVLWDLSTYAEFDVWRWNGA